MAAVDFLKAYIVEVILMNGLMEFDMDGLREDLKVTKADIEDGETEDWMDIFCHEVDLETQKKIKIFYELRLFNEPQLLTIANYLGSRFGSYKADNSQSEFKKCEVCGYLTITEPWDFCVVCGWQDGVIDKEGRSQSNRGADGKPMFLDKARDNWKKYNCIRPGTGENTQKREENFWEELFKVAFG